MTRRFVTLSLIGLGTLAVLTAVWVGLLSRRIDNSIPHPAGAARDGASSGPSHELGGAGNTLADASQPVRASARKTLRFVDDTGASIAGVTLVWSARGRASESLSRSWPRPSAGTGNEPNWRAVSDAQGVVAAPDVLPIDTSQGSI